MKIITQQHERKSGWIYLLIVLSFIFLAWTVWNYFEYKGKELDIKTHSTITF